MNNRRRAYKRQKNTKVSNQSRRFYLLFMVFLLLFFIIHKVSHFQKKIPVDPVLTTQDSLQLYIDAQTVPGQTQDSTVVTENPDEVILACATKLGIPEDLFRSKKKENKVNIQMPVNSSKMDLNFANYYLTKTLSQKRWILLSGEENTGGSIQKLSFKPPYQTDQYIISLYYDKSNSYPIERPKIAIVISELGEKKFNNLLDYLKINRPVNYAIIPFRKYSQPIYELIESTKSDILLNCPMEDINYPKIDHGKHGIGVKLNKSQIEDCISKQLSEFPKAKGAINYLGSLATTDETIMKYTMQALKDRNIYFIDNMTPSSSIAFNVAQKMVLTSYKRNLTLDFTSKKETLKDKMTQITNLGYSSPLIIVCVPYSKLSNPEQFSKFCDMIAHSGYEFVYISSLENSLF